MTTKHTQYPKPQAPKVGDHVTIAYPSDRRPAVVTEVLKDGRFVIARIDTNIGLKPVNVGPDGYAVGLPVFDHVFTAEEVEAHTMADATATVGITKGRYMLERCLPVWIGQARYYRDFSD